MARLARRSRYARTNQPYGDLLVNSPDGFPSGIPERYAYNGDPSSPFWWWGNDSPLLASQEAIPNMAAVTRAGSLIYNTIGALQLRSLTGGSTITTSTIEVPPPRWTMDPQLYRPDRRFGESPPEASALRMTKSLFWAMFIRSAIMRGMGYLIFEESAMGEPIAGTLKLLNPDLVSPHENENGDIVRRIGQPLNTGEWVETARDGSLSLGGRRYRMVELKNPLDRIDEYGMTRGVLEMHAAELRLAYQSVKYATGMFQSGVPSGYLKSSIPNFNKPQADRLKEQWLREHSGDIRSVAVLNATTEYVPISLSPVDIALIQNRQMSLLDIANAFGIPAYMIGGSDGGSNTYSNAESRNSDFRQFSLAPWAVAFEEVLTALTVQGAFIVVDFRGLLRPDTSTRYAAYAQAISSGWMTVDEVRRLENMPGLVAPETPTTDTPAGISDPEDLSPQDPPIAIGPGAA